MISANGLVRHSAKTRKMMDTVPEERPLSIQIFGSEPTIMAKAAVMVESAGAAVLDINFGCSVRKIVKNNSGVALMREPQQAKALIAAVRKAIKIPFTIKMRTGWDPSGKQAFSLAHIAEECGVDAIAVHPRTASQGFGGRADWSLIAAIKSRLSIPVIGNGDIFDAGDALRMFDETGCDFVMIGRSAISNPWIFQQVNAAIKGEPIPEIDHMARFGMMRRYLKATVEHFGETHACLLMRSRLGWFAKGMPYSSKFREAIKRISSENEALDLIGDFEAQVRKCSAA
jgi:nifR3 family TIM-barrel protein